ncbi:MAG TPA: polyprenyl synthetase family protein [Phnomibacter sp.]|nr:polyprenyl synthetase family protein [Phnomibacter sp.]
MQQQPEFSLIKEDLDLFEKSFKKAVKSRAPLLDRITHYIINRKGKQLRPKFVILSARLFGPTTESTFNAASLVELLHTATLVHDDVVDESMLRRSFFSINALWKNKVAVLVGDYLLSKGLLLSLDNNEHKVLQILSNAVRKMSEGELLQIEKARKLNLDEEIYYEIIRNKTASLLASACGAGAWSTSRDETITEKMMLFGEKTGMAFQIKDDLFDYGTSDVGKPTGNDIKEKKLTLPLIFTLGQVDKTKRRKMIYVLKNENENKEKVQWVIDEVSRAGGIDYSIEKMFRFRDEALAILSEMPQNEANKALEALVRFTTDRSY